MTRGFAPENGRAIGVANRAITQSVIPVIGLLHEWKISDNSTPLVDSEGSNDLDVVAGTFDDTTESWKDGWGFETDGTDDYAEGQAHVDSTKFSACLWLRIKSSNDSDVYFNNGENGEEYPQIYNSSGNWRVGIRDDTGTFHAVSGNAISTGTLTLITVRYGGSNLELVENTTQTGSVSVGSITKVTSTSPPTVGNRADGAGGYELYSPLYADWGLHYNRRLDDTEVQDIYDAHPST